jgi:hypothetical protein
MIDSPGVSPRTPPRVRPELFAQEQNPFHQGGPDGVRSILPGQIEMQKRCLDRSGTEHDPFEEPEEHDQIVTLLESVSIAFVRAFPT